MSFDGEWSIQVATPIGQQTVALKIVDNGKGIEGTATQGSETVPFLETTNDGDRLCWTQHVTKPMRLAVRFDLVRVGDALSGTAKAGIFPLSRVVGARVPRSPS
jgi:hypothetical protein